MPYIPREIFETISGYMYITDSIISLDALCQASHAIIQNKPLTQKLCMRRNVAVLKHSLVTTVNYDLYRQAAHRELEVFNDACIYNLLGVATMIYRQNYVGWQKIEFMRNLCFGNLLVFRTLFSVDDIITTIGTWDLISIIANDNYPQISEYLMSIDCIKKIFMLVCEMADEH